MSRECATLVNAADERCDEFINHGSCILRCFGSCVRVATRSEDEPRLLTHRGLGLISVKLEADHSYDLAIGRKMIENLPQCLSQLYRRPTHGLSRAIPQV